jgi:glycogen debranching enzyme
MAERRSRPKKTDVPQEWQHMAQTHREKRILQHGLSALVADISLSLTVKNGGVFALCQANGDIDAAINDGDGLYFHDTRYLDRATLRINGQELSVLLSTDAPGDSTICELTNPELDMAEEDSAEGSASDATSARTIPRETLGIRRERRLAGTAVETIQVRNYNAHPVSFTLDFEFAAHFDNMFVVRGAPPGKRGRLHPPRWSGKTLTFRYDGADGRTRTTALAFQPMPDVREKGAAHYQLELKAGQSATIVITASLRDDGPGDLEQVPHVVIGHDTPFNTVKVETANALFDRVLERSFTDLRMLVTPEHGDTYFAAGVPWYVALFGRDSIITALQTLTYDPAIAANTLRVLARYQGTKIDAWRDEEPGKILHELRTGEKANLHEVPQTPYYGTVDATPLFVILAAEYVRWSGDRALWDELRDNVARALQWIADFGDHDGDGFIDYLSTSTKGLANQGWKDSGNSIAHRDGSLAEPPIALVEVQGYVYRAWRDAAWLYELDGDNERAEHLRVRAEDLRQRFARAYWMPDRRFLAVALQKGGVQVQSITSNAGQALWSGIVAPEHAAAVAETLLNDAMFSGWGIRTLAEGEAAYNPIDYQVGSVWPHDNSLIAAGLKRYGFTDAMLSVFEGIFAAAASFEHYQLPEVFAGYSRRQYPVPVRYPVACSPQAWAAGAIPYLLRTCLGLVPDATRNRLRIVRPALPRWLPQVSVHGLRIGQARVSLRYQRADEITLAAVTEKSGALDVQIEY